MLKNGRGFTLIELIVVIAILGVLVLLAAPRLLGYTENADEVRIKNDIKVAESFVMQKLIEKGNFPDGWHSITQSSITQYADDGYLYDVKGEVEEVSAGNYKSLPDDSIDTKLGGEFYANEDGKVYYKHTKSSGTNEEVIRELDESLDVPIISFNGTHANISADGNIQYKLNNDRWRDYSSPLEISSNTMVYTKVIEEDRESVTSELDIQPDGFTYSIDGNNATITGYKGTIDTVNLTIPSKVVDYGETYQVKVLGERALEDELRDGTVLTIQNGIETIEYQGTEKLSEVYLPESVSKLNGEYVEGNPFVNSRLVSESSLLTKITVDANNENYRSSPSGKALYSKDTKRLVVGTTHGEILDSVEVVGASAFEHVKLDNLESIVIPDSVKSIEFSAFKNTKINRLEIGSNLENVAEDFSGAFIHLGGFGMANIDEIHIDNNNPHYKILNNHIISNDGKTLVLSEFTKSSGSLIIPEGVEVLARNSINFSGNRLSYMELPSTLTDASSAAIIENTYWLTGDTHSVLNIKSELLDDRDFRGGMFPGDTMAFTSVFDGAGQYEYEHGNPFGTWSKLD